MLGGVQGRGEGAMRIGILQSNLRHHRSAQERCEIRITQILRELTAATTQRSLQKEAGDLIEAQIAEMKKRKAKK